MKLGLNTVDKEKIKIIIPLYKWDDIEISNKSHILKLNPNNLKNIEDTVIALTKQMFKSCENKLLLILKLTHKHWANITIEKNSESINIVYMDTEQSIMPYLLKYQLIKQIIINSPNIHIALSEIKLDQPEGNDETGHPKDNDKFRNEYLQEYNSCKLEITRNLAEYLISDEKVITQDDTKVAYLMLLGDSLLLETVEYTQ